MKTKLINCTLLDIQGNNVKGIVAQVRNPKYINAEFPALWRTLTRIRTYKERGKDWIELYWERKADDSCNFTGCTIESNLCKIQFTPEEFSKMNKQTIKL